MTDLAHEIQLNIVNTAEIILQDEKTKAFQIANVKNTLFQLKYLLFTTVNYMQLTKQPFFTDTSVETAITFMVEEDLVPTSLATFQKDHEDILAVHFFAPLTPLFAQISCIDHISEIYENTLNFDYIIEQTSVTLKKGKYTQDTAGSYYTPQSFVYSVCKNALELYFNQHHRDELERMVDLSCGCGVFFHVMQELLEKEYHIKKDTSSTFFWGIDVDPIALQIALCSVLSNAREGDWSVIKSHFILGNPLIHNEEVTTKEQRLEHFALGRYYAKNMGLNMETIVCENKFDLILGNPPWEKIRFEERKFFATLEPSISNVTQKNKRALKIDQLQEKRPDVHTLFVSLRDDYANFSKKNFIHPILNQTICGELNSCALFSELAQKLLHPTGVASVIVKNTLVTSTVYKKVWAQWLRENVVHSVILLQNKKKIFPIDSRERFCILTLHTDESEGFLVWAGVDLPEVNQYEDFLRISGYELEVINPLSGMIPNVSFTKDLNELQTAHAILPCFCQVYPEVHFGRLIHLTAHAKEIKMDSSNGYLPIYEGKFLEQYDGRFSTFKNMTVEEKYKNKAHAKKQTGDLGEKEVPESRFFVSPSLWAHYQGLYAESFSLLWRSLTSQTNRRTTLAMILPTCPTAQSIQLLQTSSHKELVFLLGLFNSKRFDSFVRLKMPGIDLTQNVINQIPVPPLSVYQTELTLDGISKSLEIHILTFLCQILKTEPRCQPLVVELSALCYHVSVEVDDAIKTLDLLFDLAYQRALCTNEV